MFSSSSAVRQSHPSDWYSMVFLCAFMVISAVLVHNRSFIRSEYSSRRGIGTTLTSSTNVQRFVDLSEPVDPVSDPIPDDTEDDGLMEGVLIIFFFCFSTLPSFVSPKAEAAVVAVETRLATDTSFSFSSFSSSLSPCSFASSRRNLRNPFQLGPRRGLYSLYLSGSVVIRTPFRSDFGLGSCTL